MTFCKSSSTAEEHTRHMKMVLQHLIDNGLDVKTEKFEFSVSLISFPKYILTQGLLRPDIAKIKAMINWQIPPLENNFSSFA